MPALQSLKFNLVDALKEGGRGANEAGHRHWVRSGLVVAEIALALMLLTGAGLLIRGFSKLSATSPGFNPHGALMVNLSIPREKYNTPEKQAAFVAAVVARFQALPGVQSAAATHVLPFSGNDYVLGLEIKGKDVAASDLPSTSYFAVTPDYFPAMGIPLLRGRVFTEQDRAGGPPVAIIGQSLARQFFPDKDPIGQRINMTNGDQIWREVVGVVGDVKNASLDQEIPPQSYDPFAQQPFPFLSFVVRAPAAVLASLPAQLRQEVHAVDPEQPVFRIESLDNLVAASIARERFAMTLFGIFSALALVLAAIGIYGVMSYAVSQRTGEIGIRMALGASPGSVLQMVLRSAMRIVALGLGLGLAATLALAQVIQSVVSNMSPRDPLTLTVIAIAPRRRRLRRVPRARPPRHARGPARRAAKRMSVRPWLSGTIPLPLPRGSPGYTPSLHDPRPPFRPAQTREVTRLRLRRHRHPRARHRREHRDLQHHRQCAAPAAAVPSS